MRLLYVLEYIISYGFYVTGLYWMRKRMLERRRARVALVYHRVLRGRRGLGEVIGEVAFSAQMRYLKQRCIPVTWEEIQTEGDGPPGIRALVTFDDGYGDNFTRAQPLLEHNGIPAVFFLATSFVFDRQPLSEGGGKGGQHPEDVFPSEEQLIAAARSPLIAIGNHTSTHRVVSKLAPGEFDRELAFSQARFQERLGCSPRVFAYPRGRSHDLGEDSGSTLEKHGIRAAFTMVPGLIARGTHRYAMPRIGMSHVNNPVVFKVKMLGMLNPLVRLKNRFGL